MPRYRSAMLYHFHISLKKMKLAYENEGIMRGRKAT